MKDVIILQQESSDVVTLRATSEKGVLTDGPSEVDVIQESLESYRKKYKEEKESKKEWKRVRLFFLFAFSFASAPNDIL
jgi:hypothetical protein